MTRPISDDLRSRAVAAYVGGASCRAVAARFGVGEASVVRWGKRFRETGSVSPDPIGGSTSRLAGQREWLLARIVEAPSITLQTLRRELADRGLSVGYGSIWRFVEREKLSFKKKPARRRAGPA